MPGGILGDPRDLLPLTSSRPKDALAQARALLAGEPTSLHASIAHQVIGIVLRDFGDIAAAIGEFRQALRLARRCGASDREADVLASLGIALVHSGRTARGLACLDGAVAGSTGLEAARIAFLRGAALWILGRYPAALEDLRRAIPVLRRDRDTIWTARALTLRALIHLASGSAEAADLDLLEAERLFADVGQELDCAYATHNRALVAFRSGDLPAALAHLDEAEQRYRSLGTPMAELNIDRCGVLLAAGLARDALDEADRGTRQLRHIGGQATRRAELLLMAGRSALAADDPQVAIERAGAAARLFAAQHRDWWGVHSQLVLLQARYAAGAISGRLLDEAARTAERLTVLHSAEAAQAHLLAGRGALALGRVAQADRHLGIAARARLRGPPIARISGWLAEALLAEANGQPRRMLSSCRRGLDLLDEHQLTLGASELRTQATTHGAELAILAQRACLRAGRTRQLLAWSERLRATALSIPPVRPPDDQDLQRELTALREITSRLEGSRSDATPAPRLRREQRQLEREIRARTLRIRGDGRGNGQRLDPGALLDELGDDQLVEIVEIDGDLQLLICAAGRVRRLPAGRITGEVEFARSALRRLAYRPDERTGRVLRETGRRLQESLFGLAARHLGDGPIVIVPPGRLHAVPWAVLPALRDRPFTVAPSAADWLRARRAEPPVDRRIVLVRGPGLGSNGAEVGPLAASYARAIVLEQATAARVLEAMDGSWLVHLAAHGTFRPDNPLFSSLRLDDGPLTVYDIERLDRAPYRIVLPSCESGSLAAAGADELLGLSAALLPLGTAGIVASPVPVNDQATVSVMLALHAELRRGASMGEALCAARATGEASALSFVAFGAR